MCKMHWNSAHKLWVWDAGKWKFNEIEQQIYKHPKLNIYQFTHKLTMNTHHNFWNLMSQFFVKMLQSELRFKTKNALSLLMWLTLLHLTRSVHANPVKTLTLRRVCSKVHIGNSRLFKFELLLWDIDVYEFFFQVEYFSSKFGQSVSDNSLPEKKVFGIVK